MEQEITLGGYSVPLGGESLGTMARWRALVAEALRPAVESLGQPGADAYSEFVRRACSTLTLDAKLALVLAWNPILAGNEAQILEQGTDEELEAAFAALVAHAYPLVPAARPGAPMNGATATPSQSTRQSWG